MAEVNAAEVTQKILAVTDNIAGSRKRHDDIVKRLISRIKQAKDLAPALKKILNKKEGVVLTHNMYKELVGVLPVEFEMKHLQFELSKQNLSMSCIYGKNGPINTDVAMFIIIHRDVFTAMKCRDDIAAIFGGGKQKPMAQLVSTFIKINDVLADEQITLDRLVYACQFLQNEEVYCVTVNLLELYQMDPRHVIQKIDESGLFIKRLSRQIDDNVPEPYREFESLVGFLISPTQAGILWGQDNIGSVLKVANTGEADLLKPQSIPTLN